MEELNWKEIEGYEGLYEISKEGGIRSLHKRNYKAIMKQRIDRGGYITVRLSKAGIPSTKYLHRLLAEGYIPNPTNLPIVNHINGNKLDNRIDNLEWCTHSENVSHAYKKRLRRKTSSVLVHNTVTGEVYNSVKEASIVTGIKYPTLKNFLNGHRKNPTSLKYY